MTTHQSGDAILIQVKPGSRPVKAESVSDDFILATQETLAKVAEVVKKSISSLVGDINSMKSPPAEVSLEFGVDVGAEAGFPFITKGSAGANFKVSFTWKKEKD